MTMQRRDFITLLGGAAAAWPVAARAQQPAVPLVGWLSGQSPEVEGLLAAAFRMGLAETGYIAGRNVAIESHWAYGQVERIPALANDLLDRQVSVIVIEALGRVGVDAIRALNPTIPIVFSGAADPVQAGIVASLNRLPTGNITGVTSLGREVSPKRIELLHELVPQTTSMALLADPVLGNPIPPPDMLAAAHTLGLTLHPLRASNEREIDDAFAALSKLDAGGLVIETTPPVHDPRGSHCRPCTSGSGASDLSGSNLREGGRARQLRRQRDGGRPPRRHLCRPDSEG
jgi:putative ABC transport system substrate-binding protein